MDQIANTAASIPTSTVARPKKTSGRGAEPLAFESMISRFSVN